MTPEVNVDFIIPVHNSCEFTRTAVESIFKNVSIPACIWIIDNASTDATHQILAGLKSKAPKHIGLTHVVNAQNLGWIGGVNQGLAISQAPFILIANNDILVYPRAVEEMISIAKREPRIGLVNPESNEFGFTSDRMGEPPSLDRIDSLAKERRSKWVEACAVIGFCALIKREVFEKIGGLDPIYGRGYSEDDDYSERARTSGYLCARALGAYVHHFGTKTFLAEEKRLLKDQNEKIFIERWGQLRREAVLPAYPVLRDPQKLRVFCERMKQRLREKTGYIYIFVPKSKKHLFEHQHDNFWIKTYPHELLGPIFFFLWRSFRPRHKPVVAISGKP